MRLIGALGLGLALAGCATAAPGTGASRADLAFPAPGTHWITRSANQAGQQWTTTWVVLDEGEWGGRPVHRVSDQVDVLVYDKATRNWMATLRWDDERFVADPHTGMFQWPLEVGRVWESRYAYHDHQRGRSFRNVQWTWQVEAREEVRTPAGRFQAFRLRGRNPFSATEIWYAPEPALVVKEVQERFVGHPVGPGRVTTELLRYAPPGGERWFGFSLEAVNAAVQRGQGREALAFHEREAADLERRGLPFEAAQAHVAAMWAARPLGLFQRSLKAGARAIELLRAERRNDDVLSRLANAYFTMGNVYRMAGDRAAARRFQEEGAALTAAFEQSRSRLFWSAVFARGLAQVALAEADYPTAIRQGGEAIQALERFLASLHTDSPFDQARRSGRTNLGWALTLVGNTHRRAGNAAAAEPLLQRALGLARELRNDELALDAILPLGWVAQGRGDHAAALARFEEGRAIATRLNHASYLMWLHSGTGWSLFRTGRYDDYLMKVIKVHLKYIKGCNWHEVSGVVEKVIRNHKDHVYRYTRDLIKKFKRGGYILVAISGSPEYMVARFARHMGFHHHFGQKLDIKDGLFTGKIVTLDFLNKKKILKGFVKREKLNVDWKNSVAVGDTDNDIPMLKMVGYPIAFNPNRTFASYSMKHGWDVVVERKDTIYKIKKSAILPYEGMA